MKRFISILLAALVIVTASGCATVSTDAPGASISAGIDKEYLADAVRSVNRVVAPMPLDTVIDVEPTDDGLLSSSLPNGFTQDQWSPENAQAPPTEVALSLIQHSSPRWVFNKTTPSFVAALQTSLVPDFSVGSGTPTFTRASTAYVFGYGPTAVLGVDSPIAILVDSGEARFMGARRISANNWSAVDANGVPLTTVTPYTDAGGPFGYLSEGDRSDVLGTTAAIRRTMSDIGWVATNMTVATTTGVDGVAASAARLTATANNATILFTPGLLAGVRTFSSWCKRITGTGATSYTVDVADGYVAKTLTSAYVQNQVTSSSAVPVVGYQLATSGDMIDCDFNTLEAATFANPTPIPVNVSKAADVLSYPLAGNLIPVSGSVYAEVTFSAMGAVFIGDTAGQSQELFILNPANTVGAFDGTNVVSNATILTLPVTLPIKIASSWSGTTMSVTEGGTAVVSGAFVGTVNTNGLQIGAVGASSQPFGTIRSVRIYPVALSEAKLQAMTADATSWLGDPWWNVAANDSIYRKVANQ